MASIKFGCSRLVRAVTLGQSFSSATVANASLTSEFKDTNPRAYIFENSLYTWKKRPYLVSLLSIKSNDKPTNMTISAEFRMDRDDNILRPRAVKSMNPEVLRTLSEEGFLKVNGPNENGKTTAETRSKLPPELQLTSSNISTAVALPQFQ
jgi:hypothetical protein